MAYSEEQPLKTTEHNNKQNITLRDRMNSIKQNICIEPLIVCESIPRQIVLLATQNLNLEKACRVNKNYGDTVCDALIARQGNQFLEEEKAVQQLVAGMESWKNFICTAFPCLLILFIGAWSDRSKKRKICLLVPIIGNLMLCLSNVLNVYYFYELPLQITVFFEAFYPAISGGQPTLYMGAFALMSDVTSEESRTFRIGVLYLCFWVSAPIGTALSGILLKHIGYYGVFSLSSLLYTISIVYGFYYIEDPKKNENLDKAAVTQNNTSTKHNFFKSFFDIKHVKDTFTVAFKKGSNNRRKAMILVLASIVLMYGATSGELVVVYMFTRYRFNWDALTYSYYRSFNVCSHLIGLIIAVSFFSRLLKWNDAALGLISIYSKTVCAVTTALARNSTDMYIGAAADLFTAAGFTALRSYSSKLCSKDDQGKMTSMFNLLVVATSTAFVPIYSWIYMYTVEFDACIIYYISTVLTIPNLFIFGWIYKQLKRCSKDVSKNEERDGEMGDVEEEEAENTKEDTCLGNFTQ